MTFILVTQDIIRILAIMDGWRIHHLVTICSLLFWVFKVYYSSDSNGLQVRMAVKMILRIYEKEVKISVDK